MFVTLGGLVGEGPHGEESETEGLGWGLGGSVEDERCTGYSAVEVGGFGAGSAAVALLHQGHMALPGAVGGDQRRRL